MTRNPRREAGVDTLLAKLKLPGADDFTSFLQSYIARWAGRAGIL
jgi:hypothetical protein